MLDIYFMYRIDLMLYNSNFVVHVCATHVTAVRETIFKSIFRIA